MHCVVAASTPRACAAYPLACVLPTHCLSNSLTVHNMAHAPHQLGQAGEAAAADYYLARGYRVLVRGYRYRRAEVDLVLQLGTDLLVFTEVKTRSTGQFGTPETFVSDRKKQLFRLAATELQEEMDWRGDIRFDIVALTVRSIGFHIEHFADAFY